ncbi:MAG: hypothetical protein GWN58_21375, partial [Anaerolineae bacterium]|nr:hypothetical protein [Anaerolineae bacterium]
MLLLGLWGLTLLILWARRTGYLVSGALLQITLGASVALSVWGPPGLASTGIELRLFEGAQPLALAARALSPIVLLAILLTYVWGEQEEANTLLVSTTAVVVFVGIVLPLLFWVGQLLRSLLDPGVAVPEVARGPRSQIAQSAALIGGLYGQLVAYHFFGGRFGWGRPGVIGGGSFLMGGWLHAFLVATGTQFGTADWIPSLQAELWGWGTVTLFLWPLTMLALPWLSRGDVTRGDPRGQPLGQSLREVFSLQRALEESEHQLAGLNEKLRRLTAVRQG